SPAPSPATSASATYTLSLHDALPICQRKDPRLGIRPPPVRAVHRTRPRNRCHRGHLLLRRRKLARCFPGDVRGRRLPLPKPNRRSEEHTSELQSRFDLVCRLLLEKKK